jgi:hypothetical protein
LAFALIKSKGRSGKNEGYKCAVSKVQVELLALHAFHMVLGKKQSKFRPIICWIDQRIGALRRKEKSGLESVERIVARRTEMDL